MGGDGEIYDTFTTEQSLIVCSIFLDEFLEHKNELNTLMVSVVNHL